jgi:hypothetical protein
VLRISLQDPLDMKLVHVSTGQELDDSRSLADLKVQNDEVLGLCFKKETSAGTCSTKVRLAIGAGLLS